jgi:hypothetical protein
MDSETLSTRVAELRETVHEFEEHSRAESPRAAIIDGAELDASTLTELQTARRNLKIARAALAIADAADTVNAPSR